MSPAWWVRGQPLLSCSRSPEFHSFSGYCPAHPARRVKSSHRDETTSLPESGAGEIILPTGAVFDYISNNTANLFNHPDPMEPLFKKSMAVRSYEVDIHGVVRPASLLNYMMEAAGDHARILGISVRDLIPRGLTWVLSRTHLRISSPAAAREELLVRTWLSTRKGRFACREFEISGHDGRLVAGATCSFAVIDLNSRKSIPIDDRLPAYPLLQERAIADDFASLPRLSGFDIELSFRVGRSDLDVNRHANNVSYLGWALETVPDGVAENCHPVDLEIAYRAEVFLGETVVARCKRVDDASGPVFHHQLVRREDNLELTRLVTRWRERPKRD
jgi:acyl-ACP thioesterase